MSKKKAFALRLDPAMHDSLQRWADAELRSINAQIEWALRDALRRAGRWPADPDVKPTDISDDTPAGDSRPE